jgi:cellulose synthase/poly-beta-1,6-N-acetylglucosamine synthase-like glycosyltransferase
MNISYFSGNHIMDAAVFIFGILFLFLLFMTITFIISLFKREKEYPPFAPPISIIIPAYNEEKAITTCLEAVLASKYDKKKMQIIVVDDQSTDKTASHVKNFIAAHKEVQILLLSGKHEGKSGALNRGVTKAKYEIIVSMDSGIFGRCVVPVDSDGVRLS